MSTTAVTDEAYDGIDTAFEDEGGLSGFWILTIFLVVFAAFWLIVHAAYQKGLSTAASDADLPTVAADPRPMRQEVELANADSASTEVFDELNDTTPTAPTRPIADIDPDRDPLAGYEAPGAATASAATADEKTPEPAPEPTVVAAVGNVPSPPSLAPRSGQAPAATRPAASPPPPAARPTPAAATPAPATTAAATTTRAAASGPYAVQVGAYGSNDEAMTNYRRLSDRYGALVAAQMPTVNVATVKGTTYHRLWLGGFDTNDAAAAYCKRLSAAGQGCFVQKR